MPLPHAWSQRKIPQLLYSYMLHDSKSRTTDTKMSFGSHFGKKFGPLLELNFYTLLFVVVF